MANAKYDAELVRLRKLYVEATPSQRYSIGRQRIQNLDHGPNVLVACVSAVEGLARSLAMHSEALGAKPSDLKSELSAIYPNYRYKAAEELIGQYLLSVGQPKSAEFFGTDSWQQFRYAVQFRNVLAHECTYLREDLAIPLIDACQQVLNKLAHVAGLKAGDA